MTQKIKYLLILIIVFVPIILASKSLLSLFSNRHLQSDTIPVVSSTPQLPAGWVITTDKDSQIEIEKTNIDPHQKIKPSVVFTSRLVASSQPATDYVDRLKSGAVLTIPSLKYTADTVVTDQTDYTRRLTGHYTNSGVKIHLIQVISISEDATVNTFTASYLGDEATSAEIEQVFDYLLQTKLKS